MCWAQGDNLRLNPKRTAASRPDIIKIQLDPKFYGKIDLLEERFKEGLPSLVNCETLNIEGDVYFESDVTIKDKVSIKKQQELTGRHQKRNHNR